LKAPRILIVPILAAIAAAICLGSCSGIVSNHEAPMLRKLVSEGKLPSLSRRLPKDPYVQAVSESIGTYGGTIHGVWKGKPDKYAIGKMTEEYLLMLTPDGKDIDPNLVSSYEISDSAKKFDFTLRKGVRWSDGEPFTTDDILFFWQNVMQKPDVFGSKIPSWILSPISRRPATISANGPYRFSIQFDDSYANFPYALAIEGKDFFLPAHYFKTILPEFVGQDKAENIARDKGYASLKDMLNWEIQSWYIFPGIPSLRPWVVQNSPDDKHTILQRNPYYWKVDKEGNQLPYIDSIDFVMTNSSGVIQILAQTGCIDFQLRSMPSKSTLEPYQTESGYHLVSFITPGTPTNPIQFNQTVKDPFLRKLFTDRRFRIALSIAIDRNAILSKASSNSKIAQFGPGEDDPFYSKRLASSYIDYDIVKANQLLDQTGIIPFNPKKGYRVRPDGTPLTLKIAITSTTQAGFVEQIAADWKKAGILVESQINSSDGFSNRLKSNDLEIGIQSISTDSFVMQPSYFIPTTVKNVWAGLLPEYLNDEEKRASLDPDFLRIFSVWRELSSELDETKRKELAQSLLDIYAENIWVIGTLTTYATNYAVVSDRLMNVPDGLKNTDALRTPMNAKPQQFYFKKGK
jgi:peptide/nickel transport system substrate-binding protein